MFKLFNSKKIEPEVFEAYMNKLPKNIKVIWEREDDGYIVGDILAGDYEFATQGKNGDDFIKMVNDAIFTMYDVKREHIDVMEMVYRVAPSTKEGYKKLRCKEIPSSRFELALATN